jgi:hypothetical protein
LKTLAMRDNLASLEETPAVDPAHFVFGGVAFEICAGPGVTWAVGAEHRLFTGAYATSPVAGMVHCVVSPAPELEREPFTREIRWEWAGEVARVETGRMRAELRRLGSGRYAATAMVVPTENGCSALVTALTAAVVNREGGFVLHSAGVELDGRAILFIGPSGAGKTTAANHCRGARWIARDRAAVYPTPLGWYASGLAGGDAIDLPRARSAVLPLAAVFRVRHAVERGAILTDSRLSALRNLRESVMCTVRDPVEEADLLERVCTFVDAARVAELAVVLGEPLSELLRESVDGGRAWA